MKVPFGNPESEYLYDRHGNVLACKCGREAISAIIGKDYYMAWCIKCAECEGVMGRSLVVFSRPDINTEEKNENQKDVE